MKVDIRTIHCELKETERDYAVEKIGKLEKYYKNIIAAEITFECHEAQAEENKRFECKVRLSVPGKDLFADGIARNIKGSIDAVESKLKSQVHKLSEQRKSKKFRSRAKEFITSFFGS